MNRHLPIRIDDRQAVPLPPGVGVLERLFRILRRQTSGAGELRLAVAVLEDAVRSLHRTRGARDFFHRLLRWEVEQWFASRECGLLFSFESICSLLDLDADEIRRELGREKERGRPGALPPAAFFRKRLRGRVPPARLIEDPAWAIVARRILAADSGSRTRPSPGLDIRRRLPVG